MFALPFRSDAASNGAQPSPLRVQRGKTATQEPSSRRSSWRSTSAIDLTNGRADIAGWMVVAGDTQLTLAGDGGVIVLRHVAIDDLATDLLIL